MRACVWVIIKIKMCEHLAHFRIRADVAVDVCDLIGGEEYSIFIIIILIMSNVGEIIFDGSSENHDEIWDDTELIRAYDRAQRQIQNRLRQNTKTKKDSSNNKHEKSKPKQEGPISAPIPINMITPPKDEQDALHSMLNAWYMAGYHAGQLAAKNWKKNA